MPEQVDTIDADRAYWLQAVAQALDEGRAEASKPKEK